MATVTSDIGGGNNDYATITAWEADTRGDDTDHQRAQLFESASPYDESVEVTGGGTAGRSIIVNSGDGFDPTDSSGVIWTAGSTDRYVLRVNEDDFSLSGPIAIISTYTGSQAHQCVRVAYGTGESISGVFLQALYCLTVGSSATAQRPGIYVHSNASGTLIASCIFNGNDTLNGMAEGVYDTGANTEIYFCGAHDINPGGAHTGYGFDLRSSTATIQNCWAYGSKTADFNTVASVTESHNVSSDATATGTGSTTSATDTDDLVAPGSNNFSPKRGGNLIDSGTDVGQSLGDFTGERDHNVDGGGFEIGPVNFDTLVQIQATISAETSLSALVARRRTVAAAISAETSLSALVARRRNIASAIQAETNLSAALARRRNIASTIQAHTHLFARLSVPTASTAISYLRGLALAAGSERITTAAPGSIRATTRVAGTERARAAPGANARRALPLAAGATRATAGGAGGN